MKRLSFLAALAFVASVLFTQALLFTALGALPEVTRNNRVGTFAAYLPQPAKTAGGGGEGAALAAGTSAARAAAAGFTTGDGTGLQIRAIESIRKSLQKSLAEQQVKAVDAYAGFSRQTLTRQSGGLSGSTSVTLDLTGVGGEFAAFRNLQLLSGAFVGSDAWNTRSVALDETAAWQLFGALDVTGMSLDIQGQAFTVSGIVRLPGSWQDRLARGAKPQAYVSFDSLRTLDPQASVTAYEVRLPEPVPGLGRAYFNDALSAGGLSTDELVIVEHEQRLRLSSLLKSWRQIGQRAIQDSPVILPWWENSRRAAADLASVLVLVAGFSLLLLLLATWEQIQAADRPMGRSIAGRALLASWSGLAAALVLVSRADQQVPSGWRWLLSILLTTSLPSVLVLALALWHRLHDWIPDAASARHLLHEGIDQSFSLTRTGLVHTRSFLLTWFKKLRRQGPVEKES